MKFSVVLGGLVAALALTAATPGLASESLPAENWIVVSRGENSITFLNSASFRRDPDTVSVDLLHLRWSPEADGRSASEGSTFHVEVSCSGGFYLERSGEPFPPLAGAKPPSHMANFKLFLLNAPRYVAQIHRRCAPGAPPAYETGARSMAEAAALADKEPAQPPSPPIVHVRATAPVLPAWAAAGQPHAFLLLDVGDDGERLYLDLAGLERSGETVRARALLILGPPSYLSQAVMRDTLYDCSNHTRTIQEVAYWRSSDDFNDSFKPNQTQPALQSPLIAAELAAACSRDSAPQGPVFDSLEAAWVANAQAAPSGRP